MGARNHPGKRELAVRVIVTVCLLGSALWMLGLYRSIRALNSPGGGSPGLASSLAGSGGEFHEAGWVSGLRGPFVLNGMTVAMTEGEGPEAMEQNVRTMAAEGWREIPTPPPAGVDASLVKAYRILQRGNDTRLLMQLGWIPGTAICTLPAGLQPVSPLPALAGEWADVPGRDSPGVRRPEGARRMMSLEFSCGSMVCYQLPSGSAGSRAAGLALKSMAETMIGDGWNMDPGTEPMKMFIFRRRGAECWIWTQPSVADVSYIAVLMRGTGET